MTLCRVYLKSDLEKLKPPVPVKKTKSHTGERPNHRNIQLDAGAAAGKDGMQYGPMGGFLSCLLSLEENPKTAKKA